MAWSLCRNTNRRIGINYQFQKNLTAKMKQPQNSCVAGEFWPLLNLPGSHHMQLHMAFGPMPATRCRRTPTGSLPMWLILYNKLASSSLMCIFLPVPASRYSIQRKFTAKNTQKRLNLKNPHWICLNCLPENPEIHKLFLNFQCKLAIGVRSFEVF